MAERPLVLHMLTEYREVIRRAIALVGPRSIVEIGSESGEMSVILAGLAADAGASFVAVEPSPSPRLRALGELEHVDVVEGYSPDALDGIQDANIWIIDGDHNYWTVTRELRAALTRGAAEGLVVLHDVGWPCGRRDFYYSPERLPPEAVHEHDFFRGVAPGDPGLRRSGWRGAGSFAVATHEGGERNGVRSAVEDVLAEHDGFDFVVAPPVFGVGFVFPSGAAWAPALRDLLAPLAASELIHSLEDNRVRLVTRVIELQDEVEDARSRFDSTLRHLEQRLAEAEAEVRRLRETSVAGPQR